MINWKQKLTSRKFWLCVAGFVAGLVITLGGNAEIAQNVSGVIMSGASVVAYILAEGFADANRGGEQE